jgi:hypothetical protein
MAVAIEQEWQDVQLVLRHYRRVCDCKSSAFFVYVDYTREVEPRPFYVGRGKLNRLRHERRNAKHRAIVMKYGLDRRVVLETFNIDVANTCEVFLIAQLKTHADHGFGANFTIGGDGVVGHAQESIALMKACWSDEKRRRYSERMRQNNPMHDASVVARQAASLRAVTTGVPKSLSHCEHIRLSKLGDKNPMKGRTGVLSPSALALERCVQVQQLLVSGLSVHEIHEATGISAPIIRSIRDGRHWSCTVTC